MFNYHLPRRVQIIGMMIAFLIIFTLITGTPQNQVYAEPIPIQQTQPKAPLTPPDPAPNVPDDTPATQHISRAPLAVTAGIWQPQGPGPSYGGQVEGITNLEVSGAIHTVAAHPANADILYAGATNGGIWKTTNATAVSPNWIPQTDDKASLSIGALEFDPTDGTNNTLIAGIGRYSSFARRGGSRTGILRTTDGGTTWAEINGGGTLTSKNISGVAPRGNSIVVSVNTADTFSCSNIGIFRSTNGGGSFTHATQATAGLPAGVSHDLSGDPTSNSTLYTSVTYGSVCDTGVNGIYKSTNTGSSWSKISNATMDALILNGVTNNIEIAAHGANVFANIIQYGQSVGIFYSSNGGTSWTPMDLPLVPIGSLGGISNVTPGSPIVITTSAAHNLSTGNEVKITNVTGTTGANGVHTITVTGATTFQLNNSSDVTAWGGSGNWQKVVGMNPKYKPGGQGSIHASIRIDPANPTMVYVGGDRQDFPFPNYIGANNYTGSLFRGDPSIGATGGAPSPQWDHLTHSNAVGTISSGGTANSSAPHADSREIVFDANGNLIEVDDGGIYRRTSPQDNTGDWFSLNGDIQVTEMHNVTYDTLSNIIISGNQDTGTTFQTAVGGSTWDSLTTGDGGDVAVDTIVLVGSNQSVRYSSYQRFGNFLRTVWDADGSFASFSYPALTVTGGGAALTSQFTTPVVTNGIAGNRLLIGGGNSLYESTDGGSTIVEIGSGIVVNGGSGGHLMAYGAAGNNEILYVAAGADVAVRTAAHPAAVITHTVTGATTILGVVIDPSNWQTAYAIDSDQVFKTTDAGVNWTDITGNLTDTNLRSIEASSGSLFVGGGLGVYTADVLSPTAWSQYGTGMPHAPVWDLDYDDADEVLIAGTLGRGAWMLSTAPSTYGVNLSGNDALSGLPDEIITYTLSVTNTGDVSDVFTVTLSSVWNVTTTATTLSINAGEFSTFDVMVTIPPDAVNADSDVATVTVTSGNDPSLTDTADLTTTAVINYGVNLSGNDAQSGLPDEVITYTLSVTNTGNVSDVFTVTLSSVWNVTTTATTLSVNAGATDTFDVMVTIPSDAANADSDVATVTVTSSNNSSLTDTADLTTTAVITYGVNLSGNDAQSGLPDEVITYTLSVTNTGNVSDVFTVTLSSVWNVTTTATTLSVNAGATDTFDVMATVPSDAANADSDVATVTVTSSNNSSLTDTADLTTTAVINYGVNLSGNDAQSGLPDEVITYTLSITNTGDVTDVYTITLNSNWNVTATLTTISVNAAETGTFDVMITIPSGAVNNDSDVATVTVTSGNDPVLTDTADLETTAILFHYIYLPVILK